MLDLGAFPGNDSPSIPNRYSDRTGPVNSTITHDEQSLIYEMTTFQGVPTAEAVLRDKLYGVLMFTSLGIPMLWQGQEFSEPRGWPEDGLKLSYRPVQWSWLSTERGQQHFRYYQTLIRQRTYNPALRNGALRKMGRYEAIGKVLAWGMVDSVSGAAVMVVANFSGTAQNLSNVAWVGSGTWYDVFDESAIWVDANSVPSLSLPAYGVEIYSNRSNASLGIPTGVEVADDVVPTSFSLAQNFPNPFNPTTEIVYHLPARGEVTLKVYTLLGIEITTLAAGEHERGTFLARWDGRDAAGRILSSGTYLVRMVGGGAVQVRKMLLIR